MSEVSHVTLRHIRIFLAVCACGYNTTKAAQSLHMTQPAVSLAIRELEQYYGVALFDRLGRRLSITPVGQRFQSYAGHIASLFDEMELGLRNSGQLGTLRVGASITIGAQFLPGYVKSFSALCPEAEVRVRVEPTDQLERRLTDNTLDLALVEGIPRSPVLHAEAYMEDHLAVICPAGGPFRQGQRLTLDQFRRQPFLLREPGSGTREEFDRVLAAAGLSVTPLWEATSTTALINAVIHGLGIAVLPYRMVLGPLERGLVVSVTVEGLKFARMFHILWHRNKFLTPLAKTFIQLVRAYELDYPIPPYNGLY